MGNSPNGLPLLIQPLNDTIVRSAAKAGEAPRPETTNERHHRAVLHPLRFPLRGSRLIEASAGTGKTFTIAACTCGWCWAWRRRCGFAAALTPPEILVVTFTEAATKELRDRIRARLAEAADAFLADPQAVEEREAGEDLLHDLRAELPARTSGRPAHSALRLAAEWMDESAVSTIHGWCNRMLSRARLRQRQPVHPDAGEPTSANCRLRPRATTGGPGSRR
jgi:ATP-dependent exoDNAse (exonuclease V) beta subunit